MKIYLAADHGGYKLKEKLKRWLEDEGMEIVDKGAMEYEREDDYVDYAVKVAEEVGKDEAARGIVLCRNGVGMDIVSNRHRGVRCVLGFDKKQVIKAREDDDVNVLSLPADYIGWRLSKKLVKVFLETKFKEKKRYQRRLDKLKGVGV